MKFPRRKKSAGRRVAERLRALIKICAAIGFLFVSTFYAEHLPVKTYTIADGLLRDTVNKIKQDSRGFLWFCTDEGVSRFDGYGFMSFTVADGLPSGAVNDFLETQSGTIYIATSKGLARLNPQGIGATGENPLFSIFLPDDARAAEIKILYQDKNNRILAGTSNGLYKLIESDGRVAFELMPLGEPLPGFGGAIFVPDANTLYINSVLEDRRGTLWVGTFGSGLFRVSKDGDVRRFRASDDGFGDNKITALLEDRDGQIWMGMRRDDAGGVCVLDADALEKPVRKCYSIKDGLGGNRIRDILQTRDGQIWLATVPGLCRFQPNQSGSVCKTYTAENDVCDSIRSLAEDKDGNLWTGSPCGAKKIARYGFTTYDERDGLDKNQVNAMFENSDGELFAANFPADGRVISRFDGEKFASIKPRLPDLDYHGYGWHQTVFQDSRGAWWIPTGYGIYRSPDHTSFENLASAALEKLETGATSLEAFRLFEDSRGDVWMATTGVRANELFRWERARNVWHDYSAQSEISLARVGTAFAEDRDGNVWIGASSDHGDGALIRYRSGEFRVFTADDGAPSGWTTDLFVDRRGRLWITTSENGLLRLDDTGSDKVKFVRFTPANGLTSLTTNCVTEDELGRIYVGTWRGVDRLNPDTGQIENFSNADGLPSGYVQSAYRDRQNDLWFMTERGLARFRPESVRERQPPNILINGLRLSGEARNVSILGEKQIAPLDLRADQRQITIDFVGLGASLGEPLKYEYRLNDADWTQTRERTVNFANLAAGDYEFEVRAVTADRIYSPPATLSFHIAAPIYFQPWFLLLAALLTGALIFYAYRFRVQRLLEMERVRTRIATDLHDDIGANLTKISILSEVAHRKLGNGANGFEDGGTLLENIAETSRESVSAMSDIVWAINPKKDSLADLTRRMRRYAEEVLEQRDISLQFDASVADLRLDANVRRNVYLIFKEAVNNVVRHSRATAVRADFRIEHNTLVLEIEDNGAGFDQSKESDGNGLASMRKRAAELKGNLEIESLHGTRIVLCVEFARAFWS